MTENRTRQIERRIKRIKEGLAEIGPMRPGSLTQQFKVPKEKKGPYWQISFTRDMKSKTEYVRTECVADIRKQIAAYKRFKMLTEEWIGLSIEASKMNMIKDKKKGSK